MKSLILQHVTKVCLVLDVSIALLAGVLIHEYLFERKLVAKHEVMYDMYLPPVESISKGSDKEFVRWEIYKDPYAKQFYYSGMPWNYQPKGVSLK